METRQNGPRQWLWVVAVGFAALSAAMAPTSAQATESGASLYLLGEGGPQAAILPPLKGVFFDNLAYYYSGSLGAETRLPLGGAIVAGVHANVPALAPTLLWVPSTDVLGATLALGGSLFMGDPEVHVNAIVSGPRGAQIGIAASDDKFVVGDPVADAALAWKVGPHSHLQVADTLSIPIGDYRAGHLANLAFHRWIDDVSVAYTWRDEARGWDVSGKAGVTFNGTNDYDDYTTGTESHYEASVEKKLSPNWALALQAYYFYQLTGDSGAGAKLGGFKGRVGGIGGAVTWNVQAGKIPLVVKVRGMHEFDAVNRPQGDSLWLELSMPLHVVLPPGAGRD